LQALLDASHAQVHSTIREEKCWSRRCGLLSASWRWPVRRFLAVGLAYGNVKDLNLGNGSRFVATHLSIAGSRRPPHTELVVAPPDGRELTII